MTEKTPGPFDYLRVVSDKSDTDLFERNAGKGYVAFTISRALSYYPDTIGLAAIVNKLPLDPDQHWTFLLNSVRKKKRFPKKWGKPAKEERVIAVAHHYGTSIAQAQEIMHLLPDTFVEALL